MCESNIRYINCITDLIGIWNTRPAIEILIHLIVHLKLITAFIIVFLKICISEYMLSCHYILFLVDISYLVDLVDI